MEPLDYINRAARRGPVSRGGVGLQVGTFVDKVDDFHATVDVLGEQIELPALIGDYRKGGAVNVQWDTANDRPLLVYGPAEGGSAGDGREVVTVGGKLAERLDPEARAAANQSLLQLRTYFTHSDRDPLPEDGAGKPEGAYWIRLDEDGADAARWKWTDGEWVDAPLGPELVLREAVISSLLTNEVFTQNLTLASEVDGWLTRVSGRGLETFTPDGLAATQLGNFGENYMQLAAADGTVGVSVDQDGGVAARTGSFSSGLLYRGVELGDRLAEAGGRVVAWGGDVPTAFSVLQPPSGAGERALFELAAEATESNRYWELGVGSFLVDTEGTGSVGLRVRYTADGSSPSLTSPILGYHYTTVSGTSQVAFNFPIRPITAVPGQVYRVLVSMFTTGPSVQVNQSPQNAVWGRIVDLGAVPERSFVVRHDRNYSSDPAPTPDPPAPAKRRHVDVPFNYAWHKVWQENGQAPGAAQSHVLQGRTPYYPAAGIYRSMVGFENMTGTLSGADIERMQVRVRAEHWYSHAGGRVYLGLHGATGAPTNWQGVATGMAQAPLGVGGEVWITIPSQYYAGFRDGTYRGVTVFWNSDNPVHYGKFTPSRFAIRATYVK